MQILATYQTQDLIETLWNVKKKKQMPCCVSFSDLIETLWNVKNKYLKINPTKLKDLIETLWNVKPEGSLFIICKSGFNRDIVECKVSSS